MSWRHFGSGESDDNSYDGGFGVLKPDAIPTLLQPGDKVRVRVGLGALVGEVCIPRNANYRPADTTAGAEAVGVAVSVGGTGLIDDLGTYVTSPSDSTRLVWLDPSQIEELLTPVNAPDSPYSL